MGSSTRSLLTVFSFSRKLLNAVLPQRCPLCGEPANHGFCAKCQLLLPWLTQACPRCGVEIATPTLCGSCQRRPPSYTSSIIPFHYGEPIDRLIQNLKYNQQLHLASPLGKMIVLAVHRSKTKIPDVLLPAPLHRYRLRRRGYNQSLEIAKIVGRQLSIPVRYDLAERIRNTATQTGLSATERRRNVRGAFAVRGTVRQRQIAIIDDVVTSGSTANELAHTLLRAGAKSVNLWAVARA